MIWLFVIFVVLFAIYKLLWRGWLWKLILLIAGPICIWFTLLHTIPSSHRAAITVADCHISWAVLLPVALVTLVILTSRKNAQ